MAKITISSVSLQNFGPFRERQTLDFRVTGGRPVILVKALNGSGKTTLLTGLQVGLYGHKAMTHLRRSEYEQMIAGLLRRDATSNASVEIGVEVEVSGSKRKLIVRREWAMRSADTLSEELIVFEDGSADLEFSQSWDDFIASILPAELVQLFLFDGEKIEALANPERLPDLLKRATEVFLGIGGIDALGNDLKAYERRTVLKNKSDSAEFDSARANLESWETQAKTLESKLRDLTQEQASARNAAQLAQTALDKYTVDSQRRGLAAYEQAAVIRNGVVAARAGTDATRKHVAELMSDAVLPVGWLLSSLWGQYAKAWDEDQQARHSKLLQAEFKKRDQRIVSTLSMSAGKSAAEALRKVLADDLREVASTKAADAARLQDSPPRDAEHRLRDVKGRLAEELGNLRMTQAVLDKAEQQIGQIPAEEQIADILKGMQDRSRAVSAAEAHLTALAQQIEDVQSHLNHARTRLNAAQERLGTEFRDRSLESKMLDASSRARKALTVFKDRLLASKAQWLSDMITAEFRNLLRKRNLIANVVVDPETYRVSIKDGKGQELPMDRLSAGERQLLAISVLSALIKERKGRFPVVVDTPLARLDQQHRAALIKRFFATVSHQVVVLSTDQEVDGVAYQTLLPFTNAEYSLDFDDATGRTTASLSEMRKAA
jgi:DNA sulfur modification protein DndD